MKKRPICVDCRFCDDTERLGHVCYHPDLSRKSLVTGLPVVDESHRCFAVRLLTGGCGPDGKLYSRRTVVPLLVLFGGIAVFISIIVDALLSVILT